MNLKQLNEEYRKILEDLEPEFDITSDKTNFINKAYKTKNSKGLPTISFIGKDEDSVVGYLTFTPDLKQHKFLFSALTGGNEELKKRWNALDFDALLKEVSSKIK